MKLTSNRSLTQVAAALTACLLGSANAVINIASPAVPDAFPSVPLLADGNWSTLTVGTAVDAAITTAAAFDAKIIAAADAATIITTLGSSATNPPSVNNIARFNSTNFFLQSRPNTNDYLLLLATLKNASGGPIDAINVSYKYSKANSLATETIKGLRAYWSTTGAANSWTLITSLSNDTAGTVAAPESVSTVINLPSSLAADASFYILWADQNSSVVDPSYHIDDFAATPSVVTGTITASAATNIVRLENGPGPADDTVTFDTTITQDLAGASWTATGATPGSGAYATLVNMTIAAPLPAGNATVVFTDISTPATTNLLVPIPPRYIIGQTNFGSLQDISTPIATPPSTSWTNDPALRTLAMSTGTGTDQVVTSETIDLTAIGPVAFTAKLRARETSTGSNFETVDRFKAELIYVVGGISTTVNLISAWDTGNGSASLAGANGAPNGYLNGFQGVAVTGGVTAQGDYDLNKERDEFNRATPIQVAADQLNNLFDLAATIPSTADSVVLKIYGAGIASSEFFDVSDVLFAPSTAPALIATAGAAVWNNNNTITDTDDGFTVPVSIDASNLGASLGWNETGGNTPLHTGLYATANPVMFGPYPGQTSVTGVVLVDNDNAAVTSGPLTFTAPVSSIAATAPAAITRVANGVGITDDTVTFTTTVSSMNAGIGWIASVPTPYTISASSGAYGSVSFTIGSPGATAGPVVVTLKDSSYDAIVTTVSVTLPLPERYTIGQKDLGAGLVLLESALNPPAAWVNDFTARELRLTTATTAQVVESELVDLAAVDAVQVTVKFVPSETSAGSNFEGIDQFKLELVYTEGATTITKNLITEHDAAFAPGDAARWDKGDGASATTLATLGLNGAPDGWINGYDGTAGIDRISSVDYTTLGAEAEYNANKVRDEFNKLGEIADTTLNRQGAGTANGVDGVAFSFDFTYTIPATADTAKLIITGVGIGGTETFLVKDILFALGPVGPADTDLDGMTDAYEDANGLLKGDPADKFLDKDGDGQSNFAEFCAGTLANDPASSLRIISIVPGAIAETYDVTWSSETGKTYQAQESTDLGVADSWANLGAAVASGGATTTATVPVTGGGPVHFLRIKTVP